MNRASSARLMVAGLIVLIAACSGSATPSPTGATPRPTPRPSLSISDLLMDRGHTQLPTLLGGATAPPVAFTWADVETGKPLLGPQATAFCGALDLPLADDALTSLLFLGLNALSERFAHRPLPEDGEKVLGLAVTFAVKTCPQWVPMASPAPTPKAAWFPDGYRTVVGNPDLAWAFRTTGEIKCRGLEARCTDVLVIARNGCPFLLDVNVVFKDASGLVLANVSQSLSGAPAMKTQVLHFGTILKAAELVQGSLFLCA